MSGCDAHLSVIAHLLQDHRPKPYGLGADPGWHWHFYASVVERMTDAEVELIYAAQRHPVKTLKRFW